MSRKNGIIHLNKGENEMLNQNFKEKSCSAKKSLNTYDECWKDVNEWAVYAPNHSHHSGFIFAMFAETYTKYPIEFQMKLLFDMYVYEMGLNLRKFNAVLRKIYKAEPKEFKSNRTEEIKKELEALNIIERDQKDKEYITVYRGINHKSTPSDIAISWTYNIDIAKWFANRFACLHRDDKCCQVIQGKIYLKDILSIEHSRQEDEIVAFPHKVFDISEVTDFVAKYDYNGE